MKFSTQQLTGRTTPTNCLRSATSTIQPICVAGLYEIKLNKLKENNMHTCVAYNYQDIQAHTHTVAAGSQWLQLRSCLLYVTGVGEIKTLQ